jgi:hypothetical protein
MPLYGIVASQALLPAGPPPGLPARFIAVGTKGNFASPLIMTTEDSTATTWVDRSILASNVLPTAVLQDIAYSSTLGRWVAVGWDNGANYGYPQVLYSSDGGNTWMAATAAPSTDFMIFDICWTGTVFIAVGQDSSGANPRIMTSPDGITWTARTSAPTTVAIWYGVAGISSGLAIITGGVSEAGTTEKLSSSANDGASWTARTPPSTLNFIEDVVLVASGTHVCVGFGSSTNKIATSTDGTTWTIRVAPTDSYYGVAWNGSLYVAVGMDDSSNLEARIASSPTGTTWTSRTPDPTGDNAGNGINLLSVAAGVSGFVAVGRDNGGFNTPFIMYSAAGTTWTARTPAPTTGCILQGVGAWVARPFVPAARALTLSAAAPTRTP